MNESIYEIGYILVPSLPQEKVSEQASLFTEILAKNAASVIDEETPSSISLAYEMDKSSGGGTHQRFDQGYFGWVKFSCPSSAIETIRKSFDQNPFALRTLAISVPRERTYLGKRSKSEAKPEDKPAKAPLGEAGAVLAETAAVPTAPMTPTEIAAVDKSIDEIVKGV